MKISTENISMGRGAMQTVEVHFSKRDNKFEIRIPADIQKVIGTTMARSETYQGVVEEMKKIFLTFYATEATERKMLFYRLQSSYTVKDNNVGLRSSSADWTKSMTASNNTIINGTGLIIDHQIIYEVNFGGGVYYTKSSYLESEEKPKLYSLGDVAFSSYNYYERIPYSEALDVFLTDTRTKLNQLAEKVYGFFGKDPEILINNVANNVKLLK